MTSIRQQHVALTRAFKQRCQELGVAMDDRFFWYHTVDLGDGLLTPGSFDYRADLDRFGFPSRMAGIEVLDAGSATGFFAFEFERRGARVTSLEIPSLLSWDRFPGEAQTAIVDKIRHLMADHAVTPQTDIDRLFTDHSPAEVYYFLLDGPFQFCRRMLDSKVERVYSSVYELGGELPPDRRRFDYVFAGDMLVHLIDPLTALATLADCCSGTLAIAQALAADGPAALTYVGGSLPGRDAAEWWRPNFSWFEQVLRKLGFAKVERGGTFTGVVRPNGQTFEKTVVRARR